MLSIYMGKPGSGKSYYAVLKISELVLEYVRYEQRTGIEHKRKIYTNLNLNMHALDEFVSNRVGKTVDASKYVRVIGEEFFYDTTNAGTKKRMWWQDFDEGAFIIIDEVQYYLGSEREGGDGEYLKEFRNYISTHRHKKHDLIFITQHTDNVQRGVLSMAEDAYHIINIKSKVIPFLGIPFSDIDVIKESFGLKQQYIQILYGNYVGRSFKRETVFHELLRPEIYALYKSHTLTDGEASDRPSLHFSPIGAILWFIRKHFWHLFIKGLIIWVVVSLIFNTLLKLPVMFSDSMTNPADKASQQKKITEIETNKNKKTEKPGIEKPQVLPPLQRPMEPIATSGQPNKDEVEQNQALKHNKIYVYGTDFIITDEGKKTIGEEIYVFGKKKIIVEIDQSNNYIRTRDWVPTCRNPEPVVAGVGNEDDGGNNRYKPSDR